MEDLFNNINTIDLNNLQTAINLIQSAEEGDEENDKDNDEDDDEEESKELSNEFPTQLPYGCIHYLAHCSIIAPCCDMIFSCRLCHDEEMNGDKIPILKRHKINRFEIKKVICNNCGELQEFSSSCQQCLIRFGIYCCLICKLHDDIDKEQYHCEKCGLCRIGRNNYHCDKCNICRVSDIEHICNNFKDSQCPICFEELFSSTTEFFSLSKCGHSMHKSCFLEYSKSSFKCPLCNKSYLNLDSYNQILKEEVENTPMPEEYKNIKVTIICNECNEKTETTLHFVGHRCSKCNSFNTKKI